ncbi:hypothetical protein EPA93_11790 [Ktedonosporobacter rubrisoli]|uniref:EamA domain-containing protein n=1 Tax=Ktedonosporobacter rubrisoli TaxID=2509675 RepID=A0A4P6JMX7_KTERU|nr:EamA family transporter [Ktedonosporobacter rubrisoli]QBD76647.1 hypothetical protein EPA93_11790 [Ktedonosporobacter rubrisoli]
MPLAALGLVLTAAVMHAIWNLMVKQARLKQVFIWWGVIIGTLIYSVVPIFGPQLPAQAWPYVISSAIMEALYYITLTWAYNIDDFSLVYPLARGTAPALLALWATLFLQEPPRPAGLVGIGLLVLGLIIVGGSSIWGRLGKASFSTKGILVALATAVCISIYSAIDGAAVRFVPPAPYTVLVLGLSGLFFTPVILWRYGRRAITTEWKVNWLRIILVAILMLLTYLLVLYAYAMGNVSYAGAIREVSVVFGAFLGWRLLGEGLGRWRLIGAVFIFAGILTIAILG